MREKRMKILIADDHALFRDGLSMHIEKLMPQASIAQAGNFSQALKFLDGQQSPDLIIVDLDMADIQWEEGLKAIRQKSHKSRLVVISASEDRRSIKKALELGISGYISKRSDTKILTSALRLILEGGTYLPPEILEGPHNGGYSDSQEEYRKSKILTPRQTEVLGYVAQGLSNKQIAYNMGVSEATVKLHINALLRSVGATNRTQAVILSQKMGLI